MEVVTSEIRNKIKSAVKAKLQEIGAYVDEELPDYIMVMIANRRSKAQMNSELSLFLGNHTEKFTDWLHLVLEKLEAFAISNNTSDTLKAAVSAIPNKAAVTPSTVHTSGKIAETSSTTSSVNLPVPVAINTASVLSSPGKTGYKAGHTEALYRNEERSTPLALDSTKDAPYVPMPISQLPRQNIQRQPPPEEMEEDCLNIRDDGDQEYHPEEKAAKRSDKSTFVATSKDRRTKRRHASASEGRPSKRFSREETRIYSPRRLENRLSSRLGSVVRPAVSSQVVVRRTTNHHQSERSDDEQEEDLNQRNGVNSVIRVTARRRLPAKMQPTKSLILKAMADAQKSVAAMPPKPLEPETEPKQDPSTLPALFTRSYRERLQGIKNASVAVVNNPVSDFAEDAMIRSIKQENESESPQPEDEAMEGVEEDRINDPPDEVQSPILQRTGPTRFVVTLDGAHPLISRLMERDMNDDDDADMVEPVIADASRRPVKSRLFRRRSTGSEVEAPKQPLERCKFWPNCRQGDRCSFHHPKTPCKTFPNCAFGESCLFIHPHCKFDGTCNRPSCPYVHTSRPKVAATPAAPVVASAKPPNVVHGKTVCKFFPACNNVNCIFFHPPACKFGVNCTRVGCTFHHPSKIPAASKLKWVLPNSIK